MAAASAVLPFFLATHHRISLNCLFPSPSTNPNATSITNFSYGSNIIGFPYLAPDGTQQNRSMNSTGRRALPLS